MSTADETIRMTGREAIESLREDFAELSPYLEEGESFEEWASDVLGAFKADPDGTFEMDAQISAGSVRLVEPGRQKTGYEALAPDALAERFSSLWAPACKQAAHDLFMFVKRYAATDAPFDTLVSQIATYADAACVALGYAESRRVMNAYFSELSFNCRASYVTELTDEMVSASMFGSVTECAIGQVEDRVEFEDFDRFPTENIEYFVSDAPLVTTHQGMRWDPALGAWSDEERGVAVVPCDHSFAASFVGWSLPPRSELCRTFCACPLSSLSSEQVGDIELVYARLSDVPRPEELSKLLGRGKPSPVANPHQVAASALSAAKATTTGAQECRPRPVSL